MTTTVENFATISELCGHLNNLQDMIREFERSGEEHEEIVTRHEYEQLTQNLPVYGGAQPADTRGIFSWSADQILIWCDKWIVEDRELD